MTQAKRNNPCSVWLVDDDQSIRWVLENALSNAGFVVTLFETASSALSQYKRSACDERPQVILTDIRMPGISGFELLKQVKNMNATQPVIMMTAYSDLDATVQGYRQGAFEYLPKPFDIDEAVALVSRAIESQHRSAPGAIQTGQETEIVGDSTAIRQLFRQLSKLTAFSSHVLISGEHGTGKTLVASAIHRNQAGNKGPFVRIDLTASTSAQDIADAISPLKQQPAATVLLKNIDTLGPQPQRELKQLLTTFSQDNQTPPRFIATTTSSLVSMVQNNRFDETLYNSLSGVTLTLPALRERRSDIPVLIRHFLKTFAGELKEEAKLIEADAMAFLQKYEWSGNVSQLQNFCRSMSISGAARINVAALPAELFQNQPAQISSTSEQSEWERQLGIWAMRELAAGHTNILPKATVKLEKTLLECALQTTGGRKHEAAKLLGWGRNTLTRKLKERD